MDYEERRHKSRVRNSLAPAGFAAALAAGVTAGGYKLYTDYSGNPAPAHADDGFHQLEDEAKRGDLLRVTHEKLAEYFERAVPEFQEQYRMHPQYKFFSQALNVDVKTMPAQRKIDHFRHVGAEWEAFTRTAEQRDVVRSVSENTSGQQMDDMKRIHLLRIGAQARLDYLRLSGYREQLRQDPGTYFEKLREWVAAQEPFHARATESRKAALGKDSDDHARPVFSKADAAPGKQAEQLRAIEQKNGLKGLLVYAQEHYRANHPQEASIALNVLQGYLTTAANLRPKEAVDWRAENEGKDRLYAFGQELCAQMGRRYPPPGLPEIGPSR